MKFALALLFLAVAACVPPTFQLGETSVQLSATDAALFGAIGSYGVAVYRNQGGQNSCAQMVLEDIDALSARDVLLQTALRDGEEDSGRVFGAIEAGGVHSVVLVGSDLASLAPASAEDTRTTLQIAKGHTVAIGCDEVEIEQNLRKAIGITMFPAGLR